MKNSQAKRLSEELLNVDQKIVADAFEIDDAKKLKEYIELKTNEAKKPFYIKPVFRRATAVAACLAIVAVTAFALTKKPDNNISSNNTSSNNNVSSNNSGETSSQNDNVIYVTGDEPDDYALNTEMEPSLHRVYISSKLQEKMAFYKNYEDKEIIYRVIVEIFCAAEDIDEGKKIAFANKEVQLLFEQKEAAHLEEEIARANHNALWYANPEWQVNPGKYPEITAESVRMVEIIEEKEKTRKELQRKWDDLIQEIILKYINEVRTERLKFLSQFSDEELLSFSSSGDWTFYMDLTAEEINILAEKGGYSFRLANEEEIGLRPE